MPCRLKIRVISAQGLGDQYTYVEVRVCECIATDARYRCHSRSDTRTRATAILHVCGCVWCWMVVMVVYLSQVKHGDLAPQKTKSIHSTAPQWKEHFVFEVRRVDSARCTTIASID